MIRLTSCSRLVASTVWVVGVLALGGCSAVPKLPGGGTAAIKPNPPNISVSAVALVSAPSNSALAKYYCPSVANGLVCRALGSAPTLADLKFVFDLQLAVENPNQVALPAAEAMVAFTAYPQSQSSSNVGAVCVALCPEGETCGPPPQDGCTGGDQGLKSMADYAGAAVGFLANVALGNTTVSDVKVRTIGAGETAMVNVRLELNPEAMVNLIKNVAGDTLSSIKRGSMPTFQIPFKLEGTVWVNIEAFGKIAAGFGPHEDTWSLK